MGPRGAVVQEHIEAAGHDLRVIVSGGRAVGCAERRPRPGEWRANVALGATIEPAFAEPAACELAVTAARILGLDLAGVDLLPVADGHVVVEVTAQSSFAPSMRRGALSSATRWRRWRMPGRLQCHEGWLGGELRSDGGGSHLEPGARIDR